MVVVVVVIDVCMALAIPVILDFFACVFSKYSCLFHKNHIIF